MSNFEPYLQKLIENNEIKAGKKDDSPKMIETQDWRAKLAQGQPINVRS